MTLPWQMSVVTLTTVTIKGIFYSLPKPKLDKLFAFFFATVKAL